MDIPHLGKRVVLCIPTLNPGDYARLISAALDRQSLQPDEVWVVDSASTDGSLVSFEGAGAKIVKIDRKDFDHGATRNIVFKQCKADIYIFVTQDAIPADDYSLENIVGALLAHPDCGLVYGRQVPSSVAGVYGKHARLFNYPQGEHVVLKGLEDIPRLGLKTAFCSNSFSAYRREAMEQIGFFPENTLFAEDSLAAANLLKLGWKIGYVPQALVIHSHDYTLRQDFCRYFDVGAFHAMNPWYMRLLGRAEGEGAQFVRSEYRFLKNSGISFPLVRVVLRNGVRWVGYRFGMMHFLLPRGIKVRISTNKAFWSR